MKNLTYLTLAIFCIFTFSACEKAEQGGCTDPYAENYESWADYDDGSCLYQCDDPYALKLQCLDVLPCMSMKEMLCFILDVQAAQEFTDLGIPFLDVYVGNDLAGSMPTNVGFLTSVSCTKTQILNQCIFFISGKK